MIFYYVFKKFLLRFKHEKMGFLGDLGARIKNRKAMKDAREKPKSVKLLGLR